MWRAVSSERVNPPRIPTGNKICETPDGRIWFSGCDHWGSDAFDTAYRYDRLWGFGNTTVCRYDAPRNLTELKR